MDVAERFWRRVGEADPITGCREWQGWKVGPMKYGGILIDYKTVRTHRLAWELTNGPIPEGMLVLHHCDNPPCCEPEHLWLGTQADNMRDASEKGRLKCSPAKRAKIRASHQRRREEKAVSV